MSRPGGAAYAKAFERGYLDGRASVEGNDLTVALAAVDQTGLARALVELAIDRFGPPDGGAVRRVEAACTADSLMKLVGGVAVSTGEDDLLVDA